MRIVHVCQQDDGSGGFKAAYRLHRALLDQGQDSRMFVLCKTTDDATVEAFIRPQLAAKIVWSILGRINNFVVRLYPRSPTCGWAASWFPTGVGWRLRRLRLDVIHLHLVDSLITWRAVASLPGRLFWTFHDMGGITGGCHCTNICNRFHERCGACPELGSAAEDDISHGGWLAKRAIWERRDVTAICPSEWLRFEAARSQMCAGRHVVCIPNSVPLDHFHPRRRDAARARFGFHPDRFYLLTGSASLANPLKGAQFVAAAAPILAKRFPHVELVLFGRGGQPVSGMPAHNMGYLADESAMADLYAACDAYVLPTLVDNLPNTLLEAIACGTPCVTFRVGGCPDVVRDGVTGFLSVEQTGETLASAIGRVIELGRDGHQILRNACRFVAERQYGPELQASRCMELYRER